MHLVVLPDVQAERLAATRALRRCSCGCRGRTGSPSSRRRATTTRSSSRSSWSTATRGYDSECAVLFPETVAVAERPPNNFGAIFCDREAARLRRVATAAADLLQLNLPPDAARLLASPRRLPAGLHPLGPDPRPRPQPRRPAVRPVHGPPARAVLDVLARGAALRPDGVRSGGGARARGPQLRAQRPVRDPVRPAAALPDHRLARAQLRRARRPAAVRLPARAAATCTGPTTA